jgi:hypothetical protein
MSIELRFPNISAQDTAGQMAQMQSYMHQLVQQLNWALSTIDSAGQGDTSKIVINGGKTDLSPEEAENTFNSIKSLIIKSADIVKAYEDTMRETFNGSYVAQSDFGTYLQETNLTVETDSKTISEYFKNVQEITGSLEDEVKEQNAYIKRGLLDYDENGNPITGIEIGETTEEGVFNKCARFTKDRLGFYGEGDIHPVAYIGTGCLYINGKAVFFGDVQMNKYNIDTSDGLAFTWVG